ncbi:MAG TPA: hypothetical protein VGR92_04065, partial [Steroidobacteraceae bacterium]|nr:hypothetical protein [Steroidobacteraceae bacterium]
QGARIQRLKETPMAGQPFEVISQHRCFGGTVGFYRHEAASTASAMRFAVFTPAQAQSGQ